MEVTQTKVVQKLLIQILMKQLNMVKEVLLVVKTQVKMVEMERLAPVAVEEEMVNRV